MKNISDKVSLAFGDNTLGMYGPSIHVIFNYSQGGLESLRMGGMEWLYRPVKPTFWRATTDNDRGNGFSLKSGMWMGADLFIRTEGIEVEVDGIAIPMPQGLANNAFEKDVEADKVRITFRYGTITTPSARVTLSYEMNTTGDLNIVASYFGTKGLPELPLFGVRMVMPTVANGYIYSGLSGETYPDRMAGGVKGIYEVEGLPVTPYLVPQDCGVHVETDWVQVFRDSTLAHRGENTRRTGLQIESVDKPFAFSCLPYTALELENATHQEELPKARRTVLTLLGAVRGVGGIDSWGAPVGEAYTLSGEESYSLQVRIKGSPCQ